MAYPDRGSGSGSSGAGNTAGLYLPAGWNTRFKAKLAAAGSARARVAVVGDSITQGFYASNLDTKSYVALLRTGLQGTYGDGGSGFKGSANTAANINGASYTSGGLGGSMVSTTGTWTNSLPDGPGANSIRGESVGATATFVVRGTQIEVAYLTGAAPTFGSFTATIDGALQSPVVTIGSVGGAIVSYTVGAGTHTVVITASTATGAANYCIIAGVSGRNSTGVIVDNYGRGNYPSTAYANTTGQSWGSGGAFGGASQGTFMKAGQWSGGTNRPADLVIWAFGANDSRSVASGYGVTPDQYEKNLRGYLDDVRVNYDTDIMLLLQHPGKLEDTTLKYYGAYADRLRTLADTYGAGYVNMWGLLRNSYEYGTAQSFWGDSTSAGAAGTDTIHPSDLGHVIIKNAVLSAITS